MISEDFNMTEVFTVLTEVIRDNFRNAKLKQHLLPALGEFLFYAATQEENLGCAIPQWDVPGAFCMCQSFKLGLDTTQMDQPQGQQFCLLFLPSRGMFFF